MADSKPNPQQGRIQRVVFSHSVGQSSPVDVVRLSRLRQRELNHSMYDPMRLEFHELHFVVAGNGSHWVDFERVALNSGDVYHVRPKQVHWFDVDSSHEAFLLLFTPEALLEAHIPQPKLWQAETLLRPSSSDFRILTELLRVQEVLDVESDQLRASAVGPQLLATVLTGLADLVAAQQDSVNLTAQRYEDLVRGFEALLDTQRMSVPL